MKVSYYPGCTLKSKAKNFEVAAIKSMEQLGVEMVELDRWNCCGAVFSLADDDLIHQIAPIRDLIRVKEQGYNKVVTLCSMCYNTLSRANQLVRNDAEKRDTINRFMDEEIDYFGEVEVVHFLNYLKDDVGWDTLSQNVKYPLLDMKVAPYYGCTLQRPSEIGIEPVGSFELMTQLLKTLGATVVDFPAADQCCGSYQLMGNPASAREVAGTVLDIARISGVEALATSCPLCEFNLGKNQSALIQDHKITQKIPTYYFTQLMAIALGVDSEDCHFELNEMIAVDYLKNRDFLVSSP